MPKHKHIRRSKIKEAITKSLLVYYKAGLTNTANRLRKELYSQIHKRL